MSKSERAQSSSFFPPPIGLTQYRKQNLIPSPSPSPSKKRRIDSSSSSSYSSPAPSDADSLYNARYESTLRVLSIWNSLERKYVRDLADDDIFDLDSGKVIQDKGVMRKAETGQYAIGCFAGTGENKDEEGKEIPIIDISSDEEEDEDEDEDEDDFEGWSRIDYQFPDPPPPEIPPPLRAFSGTPARAVQDDEEDLRAFLRAEEERRAREGDIDALLDSRNIIEDTEAEVEEETDALDEPIDVEDEDDEDELLLGGRSDEAILQSSSPSPVKPARPRRVLEEERPDSPDLGGFGTDEDPPSSRSLVATPVRSVVRKRRAPTPNPQQLSTPPMSQASVEPLESRASLSSVDDRRLFSTQETPRTLRFDSVVYSDDQGSASPVKRRPRTYARSPSPSPPPTRVEHYVRSMTKGKRKAHVLEDEEQLHASNARELAHDDDVDDSPLERYSDVEDQFPRSQSNDQHSNSEFDDEHAEDMGSYTDAPNDDVFPTFSSQNEGHSGSPYHSTMYPPSFPQGLLPYLYHPQSSHSHSQPPDPNVLAQVLYSLNYLGLAGVNASHAQNSGVHTPSPSPFPPLNSQYPSYPYSMPSNLPQVSPWPPATPRTPHRLRVGIPAIPSSTSGEKSRSQSTGLTPAMRRFSVSAAARSNTASSSRASSISPQRIPPSSRNVSPTKMTPSRRRPDMPPPSALHFSTREESPELGSTPSIAYEPSFPQRRRSTVPSPTKSPSKASTSQTRVKIEGDAASSRSNRLHITTSSPAKSRIEKGKGREVVDDEPTIQQRKGPTHKISPSKRRVADGTDQSRTEYAPPGRTETTVGPRTVMDSVMISSVPRRVRGLPKRQQKALSEDEGEDEV